MGGRVVHHLQGVDLVARVGRVVDQDRCGLLEGQCGLQHAERLVVEAEEPSGDIDVRGRVRDRHGGEEVAAGARDVGA